MRTVTVIAAAVALTVAGCTTETVVNTGQWETTPTETSTAPSLPPTNPALLANAFDFVEHPNGQAAYYFSTPSGRWQCAILPRDKAGCQATGGALSVAGAPDTVPNAGGEETPPDAIIIEPEGDAHFAAAGRSRVHAARTRQRPAVQQNTDRRQVSMQHPGSKRGVLPQRAKRRGLHVQRGRIRAAVHRSTARRTLAA